MTDLRKAAEMALEALEWNYGTDLENIENCMAWLDKMNATIPALRQALAMEKFSEVNQEIEEALKQTEQEPVAWIHTRCGHPLYLSFQYHAEDVPLYTAPPNLKAAVLAEREACLKEIAIELDEWQHRTNANIALNNVYAAIRARSEK